MMKKLFILLLFIVSCKKTIKEVSVTDDVVGVEAEMKNINSALQEDRYTPNEVYNAVDFEKKEIDIEYFKNKVFELGPSIDLNNCELFIECDCCMSDLVTFDNDFYLISYCMEETAYYKGDFELDNGRLILVFEDNYLTEYIATESGKYSSKITIEEEDEADIIPVNMLKCGKKIIVNLQYENTEDFGVLTTVGNYEYIEDLKKENTNLWSKFVNL